MFFKVGPILLEQLALVVGDIADGRGVRALARLRSANIGVINQDVASFLSAWLTAQTDVDAALRVLPGAVARARQAALAAAGVAR